MARKEAEKHLSKIKDEEPEKYACYLTAVILEPNASQQIKALASVILRRSIGTNLTDKKITLWEALGAQAREYLDQPPGQHQDHHRQRRHSQDEQLVS